jgi:hypothetical protein
MSSQVVVQNGDKGKKVAAEGSEGSSGEAKLASIDKGRVVNSALGSE